MKVTVEKIPIRDVVVVGHEAFEDARGYFFEAWRRDVFQGAGLPTTFVQLNESRSTKNVVRGLHFQWEPPMGKMMRVTAGRAFLVAVDIRKGSPTLGRWVGTELSANERKQVWAPAGFARGFCVLTGSATVQYLCTGTYNAACESGIRWDDPEIGIDWPVKDPVLSERDRSAQTLAEWLSRKESACLTYGG
jgi:dTDP-4-dehydrorhamnose 3,5-epimerase